MKLLSANPFSLEESKNLSFGKVLMLESTLNTLQFVVKLECCTGQIVELV